MDLAIPTKLDERLVESLDRLVSEGFYVSRSEAIRDAVRKLTAEQYVSMQRFLRIIAEIASETVMSHLGDAVTDVILFGSVARGGVTLESDIDLLVLIKHEGDSPMIRRRLHETIYPISLASDTPITLLVMGREKFAKWARSGFSFAQEVVREGVQLHGDVLSPVRG